MSLVLTMRAPAGAAGSGPRRIDAGNLVIGRAAGADIVLTHPLVSSRHCTITGQGLAWQLHDSSTNGTMLNGQRVTGAQTLRQGDVIGVADTEFSVTIGEAAASPRDDWGRGASPATVAIGADQALLRASVSAMVALAQTARKARADLKLAEPASQNPLLAEANADTAFARLVALPAATATAMIADAAATIAAHQRATLAAMQGTFRAALDQFAPAAIKQRARDDAAAWKAYQKAFDANDGFVEVFARELARSYGEATGR